MTVSTHIIIMGEGGAKMTPVQRTQQVPKACLKFYFSCWLNQDYLTQVSQLLLASYFYHLFGNGTLRMFKCNFGG